jgi:quercetin dioxygenase-like cupin family protein
MALQIDVTVDDRLRWFVGSLNRVVATAEETGGAFGLLEQWAAEGFSPPLHVHRHEDTALVVHDGRLRVRLGDEERLVDAGGFAFLPRDVPHTFVVTSEHAHFYEIVTPGGMEHYHIDASDPAPAAVLPPPGAPDIARLASALVPYGAEILGPPMGTTAR